MDNELRKRLLKEWGDALGVDPELQRKIETVAIDEDLLTPQERAEQVLKIMEGRLKMSDQLRVQQHTVRINRDHTHEEMLEIAHAAIDDLAREGAKFLPIDPLPSDVVYSELLQDEQGRDFRYVKMFNIESGITVGGIDIRYVKEGEPAG